MSQMIRQLPSSFSQNDLPSKLLFSLKPLKLKKPNKCSSINSIASREVDSKWTVMSIDRLSRFLRDHSHPASTGTLYDFAHVAPSGPHATHCHDPLVSFLVSWPPLTFTLAHPPWLTLVDFGTLLLHCCGPLAPRSASPPFFIWTECCPLPGGIHPLTPHNSLWLPIFFRPTDGRWPRPQTLLAHRH